MVAFTCIVNALRNIYSHLTVMVFLTSGQFHLFDYFQQSHFNQSFACITFLSGYIFVAFILDFVFPCFDVLQGQAVKYCDHKQKVAKGQIH